jgi:energy-coupling factor transporter ATP-binding protein EcfA2
VAVEKGLDDYRVVFVNERSLARAIEPGTIAIAPSSDSWNDFGEHILIELVIQPRRKSANSHKQLKFRGFFGFQEKQNGKFDTLHLRELVSQDPATPVPAEKVPAYFTMLPNMESYRRVVGQLGPDEARLALRAINDMVEADDRPYGQPWVRTARESRIFLNAFLRHSEPYFVWKNAAPILLGVEYEELDRISEGIRIRFQLAGRPNPHDLQFRFANGDDVLPQRFAIVIGKNGVGKSQTLAQIVDAALRGQTKLTDLGGDRPVFNRILGFYPSASMISVFPSERRKHARIWYRRFSMVSGRSRQTTSDLIVQLARNIETIAGQSRYEIFLKAISAIEGHGELVLRTKAGERGPVSIFGLNRGGEQETLDRYAAINIRTEPVRLIEGKTYKLSSGELSFLRFAALAGLYIENGTLLLFDEPETHLHPNFISQFVALLDTLLEQTGSAAILATHSVYFVREAIENQVTVLRSDAERMISAETPTLKTFGADVGAISYFVFGEDKPSRLAQEVEARIMAQAASWDEVFETYKDRVSLDLLGEIRARVEGTDREANSQ